MPSAFENMRDDVLRLEPGFRDHGITSLLEVGCGNCLLLEALQGLKYNVAGYEPASMAKRDRGFPVYPYFDGELPALCAASWDAVVLLGTLDRVPDAKAATACLLEAFRIARVAVILGTAGSAATPWEAHAGTLGNALEVIVHRDRRVVLFLKP
jgi:hypothetical protein